MKMNRTLWGAAAAAALLASAPLACFAQTAPATTPATPMAAPAAAPVALPFGASEVVKMYQGGIGKEVILGYVSSSVGPFRLTADQIIYLQSLGVPQDVVTAMLRRDGDVQKESAAWQQQMTAQAQSGQGQAIAAAPQVVTPGSPAPAVNYVTPPTVYPGYSDYSYAYPDYYPYYGSVVVGGGYWGWPYYWGGGWRGGYYGGGWRGGGFHGGGGGFHGGGGGFHGGGGGFHGGGGGGGHR